MDADGKSKSKYGLMTKDVKAVVSVVSTYMEIAATEFKKNGKFKFGGCSNLKLKKKPAQPLVRESTLSPRSRASSKPSLLPRRSRRMP